MQTRPQKSGKAYASIWNRERNEGPLLTITRSQSEKLTERFSTLDLARPVEIDFAMRYGNPSVRSKIAKLAEKGCERLLVLPLYPQYAAATTATVNDVVFDILKEMRWQPALRTLPPYHDNPAYIEARGDLAQKQSGRHRLRAGSHSSLPIMASRNAISRMAIPITAIA